MYRVISWIIWGVLIFLAVGWTYGCRRYIKTGQSLNRATVLQTLFLWLVAILFVTFNWNKIHILWVAPLLLFFAQLLMIGGIPLLTPLVRFVTRLFSKIVALDVINLLPYFIITTFGLTGLIIGGIYGLKFLGLAVGLIGGYILVSLAGIFLFKLDRGILPKDVRKPAASKFVEKYDSLIITVLPNATKDEKISYVETLMETIFKKSAITAPNTNSGFSDQDVEHILDTVIEQEHDLKKRELIIKLWDFLKQEWYVDKNDALSK